MIKAVIFDFGNVISKTNTLAYCDDMEKLTGIPSAVFKSVYDTDRSGYDRGTMSGEEMYAALLAHTGYKEAAENDRILQQLVQIDLKSWFNLDEAVTEWGLALQREGYKLGILSNMPFQFLDLYEKKIPLFVAADYACFSCRLNIIKPEEGIYRDCISGLGIAPQEAVFFDDLQKNIDAAKRFGINGCRWTGIEQGKKDWHLLCQTSR
jgi:putative hydrolase of the HAD superfamily